MAKKLDKTARAARGKRAADVGVDELEILHPEREVTIAGRVITVREYGFVEGLQLRALAQPLLDHLYAHAAAGGAAPSYMEIDALLAEHHDAVVQLVARAADVEPDWIAQLGDEDGDALLLHWWLANAGFFIRRVLRRLTFEAMAARRSAGAGSTTPLSPPATAAPPSSDATPRAN